MLCLLINYVLACLYLIKCTGDRQIKLTILCSLSVPHCGYEIKQMVHLCLMWTQIKFVNRQTALQIDRFNCNALAYSIKSDPIRWLWSCINRISIIRIIRIVNNVQRLNLLSLAACIKLLNFWSFLCPYGSSSFYKTFQWNLIVIFNSKYFGHICHSNIWMILGIGTISVTNKVWQITFRIRTSKMVDKSHKIYGQVWNSSVNSVTDLQHNCWGNAPKLRFEMHNFKICTFQKLNTQFHGKIKCI